MNVDFSRHVSMLMNTVPIINMSVFSKFRFSKRVLSSENFNDLSKEDKHILIKAERNFNKMLMKKRQIELLKKLEKENWISLLYKNK